MLERVTILGSGSSVRDNQWNIPIEKLPLWDVLKKEIVYGINWGFLWCNPTIEFYGDYQFYLAEKENIDKLPMVVSSKDDYYNKSNTIKLNNNVHLLNGDNTKQLTGLFTLNFAIRCGFKEIFLLGMDACAINGHTHFYDDNPNIGRYTVNKHEHYGVGFDKRGNYKTSNYNNPKELNEYWYKPFEQEKECKIYNVSPLSAINTFPKITMEDYLQKLKDNPLQINQDQVREYIKGLIHAKSS